MEILAVVITGLICGSLGFLIGKKYPRPVNLITIFIFSIITMAASMSRVGYVGLFEFKIFIHQAVAFFFAFLTFAIFLKFMKQKKKHI